MLLTTQNKAVYNLQNTSNDLVGISASIIQEMNTLKTTNRYHAGQAIYYQGHRPFGVYYIHHGSVKLYQHSVEGKLYISKISGSNELLGYSAFFTNECYNETAEALEDTVISFWDRDMLMNWLEQSPQLGLIFLNKCGQDLRDAEERATANAYKSAQARMIDLILQLQTRYGKPGQNGAITIDLKLSREDIASMIGSTLETAVRLISKLKASHLIQTQVRGSIVVLNPSALAAKATYC